MIAHSFRPYGDSVDYFHLPGLLCKLVYGWSMQDLNRTGARGLVLPSGPKLLNQTEIPLISKHRNREPKVA